ncbi:inositol monophosphatase [Entophlyctis helioformis]|nr:inositol monophosphatase [Entophlyctis helioformis]
MATHDLAAFLATAKAVARDAGARIRAAFAERAHAVDYKETNAADLVTQTDRAVEELCFRSLAAAFPAHAFIGEETASAALAADASARCAFDGRPTWIIDPIDGTMNFVHGFPYTAVSIGLCIDRRPVLGVVYNPILDQLYYATDGHGAFLETAAAAAGGGGPAVRLPLSPAPLPPSLATALLATEYGSGKDTDALTAKIEAIRRIITQPVAGRGIRSVGSAALSMCLVAEGAVDAYYEAGIHAWDVCAGTVVVREAGGLVLNWVPPADANATTTAAAGDEQNEPFDVMARNVLCVRGTKGGPRDAAPPLLLRQLRSLIEPIAYPHD